LVDEVVVLFAAGMVAVIGCSSEAVQKICDAASVAANGVPVTIANYLVNGNYAVSGGAEACKVVREIAGKMGAKMTVPLAVAGAFHTSYMEPAVPKSV
jgi:[acyl-carrier-protein] S-malonyltransferase